MFRNLFDGPHLLIVLLVILVLFGGKRLPDAARGLGRSLRIFKSEVKQMRDDDEPSSPAAPLEGRVIQLPLDANGDDVRGGWKHFEAHGRSPCGRSPGRGRRAAPCPEMGPSCGKSKRKQAPLRPT